MQIDHLTRAVAAERIGQLRREADAGRLARAASAGRLHPRPPLRWASPLAGMQSVAALMHLAAPGTRQPQPCGC